MQRQQENTGDLAGEEFCIELAGARIRGVIAGSGAPLLLVHGFPQTRYEWRKIWQPLTQNYRVVATDLRGYGQSEALEEDFTFRAMARDQLEVMHGLGFDKFNLLAHDRGARVGHRMLLDAPRRIHRAVLLDILPTEVVWEKMDAQVARAYWHWPLLSQDNTYIRELLGGSPESLVKACLAPAMASGAIDAAAAEHYVSSASKPSVLDAFVGDYRASKSQDLAVDASEPRCSDAEVFIIWGSAGALPLMADPREAWKKIFPSASYAQLESGHFIPEEAPEQLLDLVREFLG